MMGGGAGQYKQQQFNYQAAAEEYGDEDEDDMGDYGMDYYAEDDSDEDDDGQIVDPSYLRQAPPGQMFQGGAPNMMGGAAQYGNMGGYGQKTGPAGVPFYGNQNKAPPQAMSMGAGIGGGSGGFTYGMASSGGNLFGPPQTSMTSNTFGVGAGQQMAAKNPGIMQFGSISQFGNLGGAGAFGGAGTFGGAGGTMFGGGGSMFGGAAAGAADDPYANIAIDLTKVKKSEPPAKPYEQKSEEEKKKEQEKKQNQNVKSNLKREEDDLQGKRKRSVSFGKSTTFEVTKLSDNEDDDSVDYNSSNAGGKGSPRPKKVLEEKDIGDGLNEKERIKQMLEKEEQEQLEQIKAMEEWKKKQDQAQQSKKPAETSKPAAASQYNSNNDHDDSLGDSSSIYTKPEESEKDSVYTESVDDDASASESGSKQKLTYWPGKSDFNPQKKSEDSVASQSNDKDDGVCDANVMEAYLKKQQQMKSSQQPNAASTKPATQSQPSKNLDVSESSSGRYEDEDFDSYSQSKSGNIPIIQPPQAQSKKAVEYKPAVGVQKQPIQQAATFKSVLETYVKKENKFIQTDENKYSNLGAADALSQGTSSSYKEWTLQQNLKDAESIIQELKSKEAEHKQKIFDFESQLKKKDVEYQTQRRELLNATETAKRAQEQYKDALHKNNLYKIETEELIKQIDIADAKAREKEDDLRLAQAEYERKLSQQNERLLFKKGKQEERDTYEVKREHMIQLEELQKKIDDQAEEIDYFQQKVAKLESDNKTMRVGNNQNKRIKELEDEILVLKSQVSDSYKVQQENINLKNIKNELSREDQVKLQRELAQLELMVKGYQEENEKAVIRQKQLEKDMKTASDKLYQEQRRVKDLQQKVLLDREKVYVEEKQPELDIQTMNTMGLGNAISQKELQEMHETIKRLQLEKSDLERELSLKEGSTRTQINKLRDEKALIEKNLFEMEILVGDRERDVTKLKDEFLQEKQMLHEKTLELEEKVQWFRENQKLLADDQDQREGAFKELQTVKERLKKAEEDAKRARDLEKKCKLLEETIKSKNPNSIQMLLQATMQENQAANKNEGQEKQQYRNKIKELEYELEERDKDFEKRVRTLRQEQERMKQMYEKRQGQTPEAKRVTELEEELQRTKNYYNKRIREIEEKHKYKSVGGNSGSTNTEKNLKPAPSATTKAQAKQPPQQEDQQKQQYELQIEQLIKERNLLAQKLVNQETVNNRRRQSLQGSQTSLFGNDDSKVPYSSLLSIFSKIRQHDKDDKDGIFSLIQDALTNVEQLKSSDPNKNVLSQKLLTLTQEFGQNGVLNSQVLSAVSQICEKQMVDSSISPQPHQLRHMNSAANKDLQGVLSEDRRTESPLTKPPKPQQHHVHPFALHETKKKSVKDILKSLVHSGIDFQQLLAENGIKSKKVTVQKLYTLLKNESSMKDVTVEDMKLIQKYVRDHSGVASEEIGGKAADEIDIQDLSNVIMDVSVEFNLDNPAQRDWVVVAGGSNRYSQERPASGLNNSRHVGGASDPDHVKQLKDQIRQLREERDDSEQENRDRLKKLQRALHEVNQDKQRLEERLEKVEQSKGRMEKILKQNLGLKGTLKKDSDNSDILDEVAVIMKRIEYLEQQSEDRAKATSLEHGPCRRELQRMQQALEEERQDKVRLLAKKNAEVAYFRAELDALLSEMKNKLK